MPSPSPSDVGEPQTVSGGALGGVVSVEDAISSEIALCVSAESGIGASVGVVDCLGVDISILSTTCADGISFVSRGGDMDGDVVVPSIGLVHVESGTSSESAGLGISELLMTNVTSGVAISVELDSGANGTTNVDV